MLCATPRTHIISRVCLPVCLFSISDGHSKEQACLHLIFKTVDSYNVVQYLFKNLVCNN